MIDDTTFERLISISSPRLWFFSLATFLLGVAMGFAVFKEHSAIVPIWHFVAFVFWVISIGMIVGFSHSENPSGLIFPWELIVGLFGCLSIGERFKVERLGDDDAKISFAISSISLALIILVNLISLDSKIFILSLFLVAIDFLYDSSFLKEKYRLYATLTYGLGLIAPLLIGYVFITNTWPRADLIVAGISYCIALGIYSSSMGDGHAPLSKGLSLGASALLSIVSGGIIARYDPFYALTALPLLIVLALSARARDAREVHRIHDLSFVLHLVFVFVIASHFFAAQSPG